ncbi:MAG: glycosyltransferase involved in cell wall biosynthesis [Planctomycetota bacterium]|jgi:glycosyltransferase involved in cell wall biosynthesis
MVLEQESTVEHEAPAVSALDVSVIVPVTIGDGRIAEVIDALGRELDRLGKTWECIAVFDGIRGPAWDEVTRLSEERPESIKAIAFQQPFGASACLTTGLEASRGRVILTSPQYLQVDPREVASLMERIDGGADFAAPWRHPRVDPVLNQIQSRAFNWLMRRVVKAPFHDLNCYFRAIRREVLEEMAIYGDMYRFLPVIAFRDGRKVEEVKVRHLQEWGGTGIFGLGVYVRRFLDVLGLVFLTHFTLKPLRFFGTLGAVFGGLGGAITSVVFAQWLFMGEPLYSRPIFHVGILLLVLGVQVIGFGLVGEIIIYTQARKLREYTVERIYDN